MEKRKWERDDSDEEPISAKKIKEEQESDESQIRMPEYMYDDLHDRLDSSHLMPKKIEKRKSVTWDKSVLSPSSDSEPQQFTNFSPEKNKKDRRSAEVGENDDDDDEWIHYLVRKPVEVTLEELEDVEMPSDKSDWKKIKLKAGSGTFTMKPIETPAPLVWFPSMTIVTSKDSQKIRSGGLIRAHAVLTPVEEEVPGGPIFDAGEGIPQDLKPSYPIPSIRRVPKLKLKKKHQRLFAFGVKNS